MSSHLLVGGPLHGQTVELVGHLVRRDYVQIPDETEIVPFGTRHDESACETIEHHTYVREEFEGEYKTFTIYRHTSITSIDEMLELLFTRPLVEQKRKPLRGIEYSENPKPNIRVIRFTANLKGWREKK